MRPSATHPRTRWLGIALLLTLALLVLACEQPAQPDPTTAQDGAWVTSSQPGKIQLVFDVRLPDPDWVDGFPPNRVLSGVKQKVLHTLLTDLQHEMDQFRTYQWSGDPMDPPVLLDETRALSDLGLTDGDRIVIRQ